MKNSVWFNRCFFFLALLCLASMAQAGSPGPDSTKWKIKEIYQYLTVMGDELPQEQLKRYCQFIVDCQEPERGIFVDKYGETIYSVKAYYLLKRFGYRPKFPLSVSQHLGKDLHYSLVDGEVISERSSPDLFRKWLDKTRNTYDAYAAGSLMGHFIAPHVLNLEAAGRKIEDSPFIPVFQQWLLDNQGENGFWNRPDDSDFNGWNGVMKMDQALGAARIHLPHQDVMLRTVLKHQSAEDGNFTAAGGCTNHNALHTLRQWSKRNDLLMWPEIFLAMERFANSARRRYDPASGDFRRIPGFDNPPDFHATELVRMALGNIVDYCHILLDPANQEKRDLQKEKSEVDENIDMDRIRNLLVMSTGLYTLAQDRIKSHVKAEHAK